MKLNMMQHANHFVLLWFFSIVLWGCATVSVNWSDANSIARLVKTEHDDFKKLTNYTGPKFSEVDGKSIFIRAWKVDDLPVFIYQIYVSERYSGDWHFYDHAYDSDGNRMEVISIIRDVISCSSSNYCDFQEDFGLNVPRDYLENHKTSPIVFKVSGKRGEQVFSLPATYVQAFLSVVH